MTAPFRHRKLGYVALNVTDLDRSTAFYRDVVGLDLAGAVDGLAFLRCSRDHHDVVLCRAREPGLKRIGWEVEDEAQLDRAQAHFERLGLAPAEVGGNERATLRQGRSFRVREPATGTTFEYYSAMEQTATPFAARVVRIARLGHVVLRVADAAAARRSLTEDMNFRASDLFGDRGVFLRCFPNPYHHSLAAFAAEAPGLHHVNFMVADLDDVGRSLHRLDAAGAPVVYGPGRHPPSGSVFLYFLDPDGLTLEYSYGMEEFPEDGAREPRLFEPVQESLDYWGSPKDPRYARTGRIEAS